MSTLKILLRAERKQKLQKNNGELVRESVNDGKTGRRLLFLRKKNWGISKGTDRISDLAGSQAGAPGWPLRSDRRVREPRAANTREKENKQWFSPS